MISDTSIDELHAFAHELEVPERGFEGDHYDLTQELRLTAIQRGARPVTGRELVLALYAAGMRRRPGRSLPISRSPAPGLDRSPLH